MESSSDMTVTILDCSSFLQSERGGLHRYWLELRYLRLRFIKLGPVALYRVAILFLAGSYVRLQLCCPVVVPTALLFWRFTVISSSF